MQNYAYVSNNSINNVDSEGNWSIKSIIKSVFKAIKDLAKHAIKSTISGFSEIGSIVGLKVSGALLNKSAIGNNQSITYGQNSKIASSIKNSQTYKKTINEIVQNNPNKTFSSTDCYSLIFPDNELDLYLGLHKTTMCLDGELNNGKGNLQVSITDFYDFEYWDYSNCKGLRKFVATLINNEAWMLQEMGILNNSYITVIFDENFK